MNLTPLTRLAFAAVSTVALTTAATAQIRQINRLADLRNAKTAVEQAEAESPSQPNKIAGLQDLYGIKQSFAGDSIGAMATLDRSRVLRGITPQGTAAEINKYDEATSEDAIQAIVAAARDKRAVFINESHHSPMHRAFAQKLAKELHKIGFTYLACETFTTEIRKQPAYVASIRHGFYTDEPVFAQFVNSAIVDGWTLVPYESEERDEKMSQGDRIRQREIIQAKNLYERIYAKDPNAKALIYVGYAHLMKTKSSSAPAMVGTLLRQQLGENATLHIDQEKFHAHENRASEHPLYRPLLAKFKPDAPFVVRQKDGKIPVLSGYEYYVDMQVIFPDYGLENGRPQWLSTLAGRKPQAIPPELLPQQGQRLVLAYGKQHGPDAVPIDAVLVEAGKPAPALMLPEGEVRLGTED